MPVLELNPGDFWKIRKCEGVRRLGVGCIFGTRIELGFEILPFTRIQGSPPR